MMNPALISMRRDGRAEWHSSATMKKMHAKFWMLIEKSKMGILKEMRTPDMG
jgi:hypothetical protein